MLVIEHYTVIDTARLELWAVFPGCMIKLFGPERFAGMERGKFW